MRPLRFELKNSPPPAVVPPGEEITEEDLQRYVERWYP